MRLVDLIPDVDVLYALEPYELGLRLLPALAAFQPATTLSDSTKLGLRSFLDATLDSGPQPQSQYPAESRSDVVQAITEAWCWLEGSALLVSHPGYKDPVRQLSRRALQLASEPNPQRAISAHRLAKDMLHPTIREDVWGALPPREIRHRSFRGDESCRGCGSRSWGFAAADIGSPLMRKAFNIENGPLSDLKAEASERQALSDLFAGGDGCLQECSVASKGRTGRPGRNCGSPDAREPSLEDRGREKLVDGNFDGLPIEGQPRSLATSRRAAWWPETSLARRVSSR
jgi:hypothetical protein